MYIIRNKIKHGSTIIQALSTTYGLDIMEDNIQECKDRIYQYIKDNNIKCSLKKVKDIIDHNLVCHDALNGWDYENWCELKQDKCEALF